MTIINEQLNLVGIQLSKGKLDLIQRQLSGLTRSPNLVPQPGQTHENVWKHTLSMLQENDRFYKTYPSVTGEIDYLESTAGILIHDIPEGFTPHGDLNYAYSGHNSEDIRRAKELAEYEAAHHFVDHNILGKVSQKKFHGFIDEWVVLSSPLALYVRLHDMVDGNKSVIQKAMDLRRGIIQKIDEKGKIIEWSFSEAGAHISKIAATKTFPIVDELIHQIERKEASLAILNWFDKGMMKSYTDAGWGFLPVIDEMKEFLDKELKGFEL